MTEAEQNTEPQVEVQATDINQPTPVASELPQDGQHQDTGTTDSTLTLEAAQKELERARKEAARYRTQLREREEADAKAAEEKRQAELTAEERAREAEAKAQEAIAAADARVQAAERKAALTGKVADATAALKLLDPEAHLNEDGTVNTEALLESYPFLAVTTPAPAGKTPAPGAGGTAPKPTTIADLENLTPEEFEKRRAEIYAGLRK